MSVRFEGRTIGRGAEGVKFNRSPTSYPEKR